MKLVRDTTWRDDRNGLTHVLYWGQTHRSPWCYHVLCDGSSVLYVVANPDEDDGPPTCAWCVVGL